MTKWKSDSGPAGPGQFRYLAELRLQADHYEDLRRQGFVAREKRGDHGVYFKLRFRSRGKQEVRYLGTDADFARAVARELRELQQSGRAERRLRALIAEARRLLRDGKRQLEPLLEQRGLHFHGMAIRRRQETRGNSATR
jgi:hypothetical protein